MPWELEYPNKHLYQEINKIIAVLKQSDKSNYAKKLEDALSISTIPSEVLGELKLALLDLSEGGLSANAELKNNINESLSYIDSIL